MRTFPASALLFEVEADPHGQAVVRSGTGIGNIPTLLTVDDELDNQDLVERTIKKDFQVLRANNGAQAIEIALQSRPDVVVSDQRMPGMTGTELLTRLAQLVPTSIRILVTAYSDYETLVAAINNAKIDHYAEKPVNWGQLKSTIDSLLRARGPLGPDDGTYSRIATRELRPHTDYRLVELVKADDSPWGDQPICLGRVPRNDVVIDDPSVSKQHVHFSPVENPLWVCDLGSSNGTSVNGTRLTVRRPIRITNGDELCFGRVWARFFQAPGLYDFLTRLTG